MDAQQKKVTATAVTFFVCTVRRLIHLLGHLLVELVVGRSHAEVVVFLGVLLDCAVLVGGDTGNVAFVIDILDGALGTCGDLAVGVPDLVGNVTCSSAGGGKSLDGGLVAFGANGVNVLFSGPIAGIYLEGEFVGSLGDIAELLFFCYGALVEI